MSIGERLRRLDDRVLGPPRYEAPARRVAMVAGFIAFSAHNMARAAATGQEAAAMSGLSWVVFALAFLGMTVYQDRTGPAPQLLGSRLLTWAVAFPLALGALPSVLVPALRDGWPAIAASIVVAAVAAVTVDRRVRRAGEGAGAGAGIAADPPPASTTPPPAPSADLT